MTWRCGAKTSAVDFKSFSVAREGLPKGFSIAYV
jgi:hypothetical protein